MEGGDRVGLRRGEPPAAHSTRRTSSRLFPAPSAQPTGEGAGNTLYISGQASRNAEGEIVGKGDMSAQVRQVYENLKSVLASQGATLDNLVKITIFTASIEEWRETGDLREGYMVGGTPAEETDVPKLCSY